jgi:cysteine desulfurase
VNALAYLDHNAGAPLLPAARMAMLAALETGGNASSVHRFGRLARRMVEDAREQVAALAGAVPEAIVLTAGGTEANDLALAGFAEGRNVRVLVSAIEHASVGRAVDGAEVIPVTRDGLVDLGALEHLLARNDGRPTLVSVMLANNETGAIQPIADVATLARRAGARVHCDAIQAAGRLPIDMAALGVDALSLSAHKLGGPQGAGALILADGFEVSPRVRGGGQERGRRAGTENVAAIAGFGAAAAAALAEGLADQPRQAALRDRLEARALAALPGSEIVARDAPRLANTSCLALPGAKAETLVIALDLSGVAVSAGAACSSGKVGRSHVLAAMGLSDAIVGSAIRVSLGRSTTEAEIDRFVEGWTAFGAQSASLHASTRSAA